MVLPPAERSPERITSPVVGAAVREVGTRFLRWRPWIVAPAAALTVALLVRAPVPPAQRAALGLGIGTLLTGFVLEAWWLRRAVLSQAHLFVSLLSTQLGLLFGCAVSGGLTSPLLPMLFAPGVTAFAAFGPGRRSALVLGALGAGALGLLLLPPGMPFPPLPVREARLLLALFTLVSAALLRLSVAGLAGAYAAASARLERAHEALVASTEARAQSLEAIGARVAHEVKNPLSAVRSLVDLLAQSPADATAARRLGVVREEVERIEALVRDYLSFARPLDLLRPEDVDLALLLPDVAAALEARAQRGGVALVLAGPPSLRVRADPRRVREAVVNLLGNALEATPAGGRVTLTWGDAPGGGVRLEVHDTGRGMAPDELARAGTAFFTTRADGTGLGLVLARAVAAQHGGTLQLDSRPGEGTRAQLELPLRPPAG